MNNNPTKITTGIVRLSFANLWQPKSINGGKAKYSASLLIPKSDTKTLAAVNAAIEAAVQAGIAKFGQSFRNSLSSQNFKRPLRDGDAERPNDEVYRGHYFVNANSDNAPRIVDRGLNDILDQMAVYSGCFARVSVNFYPFDTNGNRGIACGLGNVQKIADGEPLGGRSNPEDDFADPAPDYTPPQAGMYSAPSAQVDPLTGLPS